MFLAQASDVKASTAILRRLLMIGRKLLDM
jgi:hypothetical protein